MWHGRVRGEGEVRSGTGHGGNSGWHSASDGSSAGFGAEKGDTLFDYCGKSHIT